MPPIDHTLADSQIGAGFGITTLPHLREFAVTGPFTVTGVSDTPSRRRIFSCRPTSAADEAACAAEIIRKLAHAGLPRPALRGGLRRPPKFYQQGRKDGGDFESGIRMAVQAILASPRFLFRLEEAPATARPGQNYRITDLDLATRLSFFLWGTGPDDELLKIAQRGTLRGPGVLAAQVKRMLAGSEGRSVVDALRVAVAAPAGPRQDSSRRAAVPVLRPLARRSAEEGNRAVLRQHRSRGPQHPRPDHAPTTRSSTSASRGTTACRT